jgi:hypothetical protein
MNIKIRGWVALSYLASSLALFASIANAATYELLPNGRSFEVTSAGTVLFPLPAGNGLSGFLFGFKDPDHHISWIEVILNCPGASNGCPKDTAWVTYKDKRRGDYSVDLNWQPLPEGTKFGSGTSDPTLPWFVPLGPATPGTVPVLTGFALHKVGDDMHLKSLDIYFNKESDGKLYGLVSFEDDDSFWSANKSLLENDNVITYGEVPAKNILVLPEICGDSSGGDSFREFIAKRPVLTSIHMRYKHGDHHIKRIGVRLLPPPARSTQNTSQLQVAFQDKNGDDDFEYCIGMAEIIP